MRKTKEQLQSEVTKMESEIKWLKDDVEAREKTIIMLDIRVAALVEAIKAMILQPGPHHARVVVIRD